MKPGKARKDRPKGPKSFSRSGSKRVERSAVARPEKRDNRIKDKRDDRRPDKRDDRRSEKRDDRKGFKKPVRVNDRELKREDRRPERSEKRFDRKQFSQDAVAKCALIWGHAALQSLSCCCMTRVVSYLKVAAYSVVSSRHVRVA